MIPILSALTAFCLLSGSKNSLAESRSPDEVLSNQTRTKVIFEPHGTSLCASGCALSRHPTPELEVSRFHRLVESYQVEPMTEESAALEELLFFGPQTQRLLELESFQLDEERLSFLKQELARDEVSIEFRLIDQDDKVRVSLPPTVVPFDRRYVFEPVLTDDFQPPEASGTVKRVGLRHIWQRI